MSAVAEVPVPVAQDVAASVAPARQGGAGGRAERVRTRTRNPKWRRPPRRIDPMECIGCDSCLRACPPQFGAIFNHGLDVVIVPELCSGCPNCVAVCPVDCIYVDEMWDGTPPRLWAYAGSAGDPYAVATSGAPLAGPSGEPRAPGTDA